MNSTQQHATCTKSDAQQHPSLGSTQLVCISSVLCMHPDPPGDSTITNILRSSMHNTPAKVQGAPEHSFMSLHQPAAHHGLLQVNQRKLWPLAPFQLAEWLHQHSLDQPKVTASCDNPAACPPIQLPGLCSISKADACTAIVKHCVVCPQENVTQDPQGPCACRCTPYSDC